MPKETTDPELLRHRGSFYEMVCTVSDFHFVNCIGAGSSARVRLAQHKPSGTYFAVKVIRKGELIENGSEKYVLNEKALLEEIRHPFIVRKCGDCQDEKRLYIVNELVQGGELFTWLSRLGTLDSVAARFTASCVMLAFTYLHSKKIVLRSLKPEDIVFGVDGYVKLVDVGLAKRVVRKCYTVCGTPEYIAPEMLSGDGYTKTVDWWTLGILIYEILVGHPPFTDQSVEAVYKRITDGKVVFPKGVTLPKPVKAVVNGLLKKDVDKRWDGTQLKKCAWCKDVDWDGMLSKDVPSPFKIDVEGPADVQHFKFPEDSADEAPAVDPALDPFLDCW